MITTLAQHRFDRGDILALQFSTRAFAIGVTWEWESTVFLLLGPFSLVWIYDNGAAPKI